MSPAETLRAARERTGKSLRQVAREIGLSPTYLSHMELGQHPISATISTIEAMIDSYRLTVPERLTVFGKYLEEVDQRQKQLRQILFAQSDWKEKIIADSVEKKVASG